MGSEFLDEESVALDAVALSSTRALAHERIGPLRIVLLASGPREHGTQFGLGDSEALYAINQKRLALRLRRADTSSSEDVLIHGAVAMQWHFFHQPQAIENPHRQRWYVCYG